MFRLLNEDDYTEYKSLIQTFRPTDFTVDQFKEFVNLIGPQFQVWILVENSRIVATATLIYEIKLIFNVSKTAHVEDVCVHPNFISRGYGSMMLEKLHQEAEENGCRKLTLVAHEDISEFYIKNGYERRGVHLSRLIHD